MTFWDKFEMVYLVLAYSAAIVVALSILVGVVLDYKKQKGFRDEFFNEYHLLQTQNLVLREENKILKNGAGELPEFVKDLKAELEKEEK